MKNYLTVKEIASSLKVTEPYVRRKLWRGEWPSLHVGAAVRVPEEELTAYLDSVTVGRKPDGEHSAEGQPPKR